MARDSDEFGPERSQTLDRGVVILELLAEVGATGLTVSDLARRLAVGRPVVYRLLATLADHELVRRDHDGTVRLGLGVRRVADATVDLVRQAALPVLRGLADTTGATAHVTIVDGVDALAVAVVEPSWTHLHVGYRVGTRHGLDRAAAGKAILAGRSGQRAVVTTEGELERGARGLAVPVLDVPGLEASVGVVSVTKLDGDEIGPLLVSAADDLRSAWLGSMTHASAY